MNDLITIITILTVINTAELIYRLFKTDDKNYELSKRINDIENVFKYPRLYLEESALGMDLKEIFDFVKYPHLSGTNDALVEIIREEIDDKNKELLDALGYEYYKESGYRKIYGNKKKQK